MSGIPAVDAALRERAEALLAHGLGGSQAAPIPYQLHELQLSQIELEVQQQALEELQLQKDAAEADLNHYAELYDQAPASYLSLERDGRISRANRAAASLLGCAREALLGKPFEQFVAPDAQARLRHFLAGLYASGVRSVVELALFEGVPGASQIRIEANVDPSDLQCRMVVTDISDVHAREAARRRAFQVLDSIEEGVLVCDAERRIVAVNPAFTRITGYEAEQAIGRDPAFLGRRGMHPPGYHAHAMRQLEQRGNWCGEVHNLRRDGRPFLSSMSLTVLHNEDGGILNYIGVFSDITERKHAELALRELSRELDARVVARTAELTAANLRLRQEVAERKRAERELHESREQLRKLGDHLASVKEDERKRIAREIHDELGQNLLALRIDISMLSERTGTTHPRLRQRVDAVLSNVDTTIRSVRGIINELRPSVLDLGLQAAIEWQVSEFRKRTGLTCRVVVDDPNVFAAIPGDIEIVLFRSLQESLTNVMRHAQASDVEIALAIRDGQLELRIADNGVGIPSRQRGKGDAFGLIGIAERVAALGGHFELARFEHGQGCALMLRFDLPGGAAPA
ncbi:PAS domain S-box protein [Oxalobacteraceae bacterium]|nr:PAS domain S-box protein [Oxalobacteraceae bacterium]